MSDVIRVLQLGTEDWRNRYKVPDYVDFNYIEVFSEVPKSPYDLVFVDRVLLDEEINPLCQATKAHTLYVTDREVWSDGLQEYYARKNGKCLAIEKVQEFLDTEVRNFFSKPYGEKFRFQNLAIAQGFSGSVEWIGNYSVNVEGDFGEELSQIA